ncbi:Glucose 1-dehydrogenase [Mesorhizobium plurifarium]|uniref:Glucose 1-dehydrogenase n=1 Tax=Mesorhizobium plurifarium TaxID=69974 RepID=A0A090EUX2_MESPL|nr:Glucose 1-dehydrogenase [Mesorhizobium sp. SOD10]CDX35395.1 Glucose 1-dehydrogenase [Mesorhizobium plurifarium]
MGMLDGKTAIVTGAGRGIGHAIATRYVAEGANVVIADVDEAAGQAVADKLGSNARFVRTDVSKADDARNVVAAACDFWGGLDILVNNAGIFHAADFLEIAEADFERVMRVNVNGTFLVGQAAARQMVAQVKASKAPGAIINMSSVTARIALPNHVPYCTSKGGIETLTKVMALSLAPYGIRANAIGPGSIRTDLSMPFATDPIMRHRLLSRTPLGRIAEPEEIASIATFLASKEASYITGETIFADGGRLALNYTVPVVES